MRTGALPSSPPPARAPRAPRACLLAGALSLGGQAHAAGRVELRSDPPGARIFVDGLDSGLRSPSTLTGLSAGPHHLRLLGECSVGEADVVVRNGETTPLDLPLIPSGGTLRVSPTPPDADVWVDGDTVPGITEVPVSFTCGTFRVSLSAPGYLPINRWVTVRMGLNTELPVTLSPFTGATGATGATGVTEARVDEPVSPPQAEPASRPPRALGLSLLGAGAVSAALGGWQLGLAYRNYDDYAALRDDPTGDHRGDTRFLDEEVHGPRDRALWGLGLGAGMVTGGLVLVF